MVEIMSGKPKQYYLYILELSNGALYVGITLDIERRIKEHGTKRGSKFVNAHKPFKLAYCCLAGTSRSTAQKMEYSIKRLSHQDKKELCLFYNLTKGNK